MPTHHCIPLDSLQFLAHDKFKFCFLKTSGGKIFNLQFVDSINANPADIEGWLFLKSCP